MVLYLLVLSCSSIMDTKPRDEKFYFEQGKEHLKKKQYVKAMEEFKQILTAFSGSVLVDAAQYFLAETYLGSEEWIQAAFEYELVYENYPSSKYAGDARFKRAYCYMMQSLPPDRDQESTSKAIAEYNRFLEEYPGNQYVGKALENITELNEKLAKKEYLVGRFYLRTKKHKAAIVYFESFLQEYPGSKLLYEVLYYLGIARLKLIEYPGARVAFEQVIASNCDPDLKQKAKGALDSIPSLERELEENRKE